MELKILFITVLFIGACAGFSLREEQEDTPNEYAELEDMNSDEPEYDTDLEDLTKGRRPICPKYFFLRCYLVKYCYRYLRICRCVPFKMYGDETEFDHQLNDEILETLEDEVENFETITSDQELEDPSKKVPKPKPSRKCPKKLIRKCFLVKYGKSKRVVCTCVPPCPYKG